MIILHTPEEMKKQISAWKRKGESIGLVPTMGFLHNGHGSLIKRSVSENDHTVVSIFVNPTQFGPNEDFENYPRDIKKDASFCESFGVDVIFNPEPEIMYPQPFFTSVSVARLSEGLCGKRRPVHFGGVCLILSKLFHIAMPDRAYFGQKDAQQAAIVKRMVRDLNFPLEVIICPIVRESDGLALSSRNIYLTTEERKNALVLNRALKHAQELIKQGEKSSEIIRKQMEAEINSVKNDGIDYIEITDTEQLQPISEIKGEVLIALAVRFGKARLIDNCIVTGGLKSCNCEC